MFLWLFFSRFKSSLQLLQLFRRMLQLCFAVKLQKCFVCVGGGKTVTEFYFVGDCSFNSSG